MKKKDRIAVLLFAVLFIGAAALYICLRPSATEGEKTITVRVEHLQGESAEYQFSTDAEYLRQALEEQDLIVGEEAEYGIWVHTVDGETADESRQQWWGYNVNGEYGEYGVETQPVTDGDVYEFVLNEGW